MARLAAADAPGVMQMNISHLPYLFGTLDARHGARSSDALDRSCRDAFAQAWVAFARHGDPGPLAIPGLTA